MKLGEIKFGHSYQHRELGQCAIVGCHPHDGAALIVAYWNHDDDEEKFVLAVPEDMLYILPDEPVMRTEGACVATQPDAQVISDLIELARRVQHALDDSEELGTGHQLLTQEHTQKLADTLTVLDLLPDREGFVSTGPIKAGYALEHILALLPNVVQDGVAMALAATRTQPFKERVLNIESTPQFIGNNVGQRYIDPRIDPHANDLGEPWAPVKSFGVTGLTSFTIMSPAEVNAGMTFIDAAKPIGKYDEHILFTDADADRPDAICDRNGQVALGQCKRCGKAEVELSEACEPRKPEDDDIEMPPGAHRIQCACQPGSSCFQRADGTIACDDAKGAQ